ncbi:hypothetical protein BMS3Abin03_01854 [bacterium BMS3Abin03]|nr:hypothetical protein BMS3Abin03_01854 [bacterium BMS3Abin03]
MKQAIILLIGTALILITGIIIYSCSCSSCSKQEEAIVPVDVLKKANAYVASITGEEFFKKYITPNFSKMKHNPPYYEMAYTLYMPEKPYVNSTIKFFVDSAGNVMKNLDITGIPRCKNRPSGCDWKIDREDAVKIAEQYGLEKGIKDWQVGFIWNPERGIYVWHILSTLKEMKGEFGYRGNGKEMIIDPINGDVLAYNDWYLR